MLPSVEREYQNKIKAAENKASEQYHIAIRKAVEVINRCKFLDNEQKETLIKELYK